MWEYLYFKALPTRDFCEEWLNEQGRKGWELIHLSWNHLGTCMVFKRLKRKILSD